MNGDHRVAGEQLRRIAAGGAHARRDVGGGLLRATAACSSQRSTTRCFNWRSRGSSRRAASSGWPTSATASERPLADSALVSRRISSSSSYGTLCASSTISASTPLRLIGRRAPLRARAGTGSSSWPALALKPKPAARYSKNSSRVSVGFDRCTIVDARARRLQRRADQRGLAGARFANQHGQAGAPAQPVLAGAPAPRDAARVKHRKRGFGERSKGRSCSP